MKRPIAPVVFAGLALCSTGLLAGPKFPVPAPIISAPTEGLKYSLESKEPLPLRISLPATPFANAPNLASYASSTIEEESWHIVVLRSDSGTPEPSDEVAEFAGPLNSLEIGARVAARLTSKWFIDHGGAGRYRIRVFLAQKRQSGAIAEGPSSSVTFEVVTATISPNKKEST